MRNPLHRRYARQLVRDVGRYVGVFVMLVVAICVPSGFLATVSSIKQLVARQQTICSLEDARVETATAIDADARRAVEHLGVTLHDNWSRDANATVGDTRATVRTYRNRTRVDVATYYAGRAPRTAREVAIDHTFAASHGLSVGDGITLGGRRFTICAIMVLPDYNTLLRSNTDFMMDVEKFGVALVSEAGFERLAALPTTYTYAVTFADDGLSLAQRVRSETKVARTLAAHGAAVTNLLDREQNQTIGYLMTDMDGDASMYVALPYILVTIMALVFVVLTNATIESESSVIGTLRASGWRRAEVVRHYLFMPAAVGLAAVVVGNALGYTVVSRVAQDLYYGSYSLPPFRATFDAGAFALTSVLPYALLVGITLVGLERSLGATPLAFLRHEVARGRRRHHLRLPGRLGYATRFRLRLLARNVTTFLTLFVGVFAGSFLVLFSLALMPMFKDYADRVASSAPANHIYVLKAPVELASSAQAEKVCIASLQAQRRMGAGQEDVTVYGIGEGSRHWSGIDVSGGRMLVGRGLLAKCGLALGDTITLHDRFADRDYSLRIAASTGDSANMSVYLSQADFCKVFGHPGGWFNAYASDAALDIDPDSLSYQITPGDLRDLAEQMTDTFGDTVRLIVVAAALVFFVVMYLLTKTVIDHSARSISLLRVLGYRSREVRGLYLTSVTLGVVISLVASLPLAMWGVATMLQTMMLSYAGNFVVRYTPQVVLADLAIGFATYLVVALLHVRRIGRVPLSLALMAQE